MHKPIVVIVGRPNVGKSTLFNRIAGDRIAIVEDLPGTTRDRIYADSQWNNIDFSLIDTGGLEIGLKSDMSGKVKSQVELAIEEADVVIFMVDVNDGVTPMDKEIANLLRRLKKPVILAANKSDNIPRSYQAQEFFELAIGDPVPISGYHDRGISDLMNKVIEKLPVAGVANEDQINLMKIAVVGRPNVGKSMLVNAILGEERSIVSEIPGTTRDALDTVFQYKNEKIILIDTGGIRRQGRVEKGIERYSVMRSMNAIERADIAVLVTDATDPIAVQDTHIAGYVLKSFKGLVLVVNKWDLAAELNVTPAMYTEWIKQRIKFFSDYPILFISAKNKQGIDKVVESAIKVYQERMKRFPTSIVNEVVREAVAAHAPGAVAGKRLKLLYVTQTDVNPPTFVFFVNDRRIVHFSYQRYLENKLRDAFKFAGTPIKMVFKNRSEEK